VKTTASSEGGLHFNILSSDEVYQVIVQEHEKQRACEDPQNLLYKPSSDRVSVTSN
jgi:hypothetical protein